MIIALAVAYFLMGTYSVYCAYTWYKRYSDYAKFVHVYCRVASKNLLDLHKEHPCKEVNNLVEATAILIDGTEEANKRCS